MKRVALILVEVLLLGISLFFIIKDGPLWAGGSIVSWGIGAIFLVFAILWIYIAGKIDKK